MEPTVNTSPVKESMSNRVLGLAKKYSIIAFSTASSSEASTLNTDVRTGTFSVTLAV